MGAERCLPQGIPPLFQHRLSEAIPAKGAVSVGPTWHVCIAIHLAFIDIFATFLATSRAKNFSKAAGNSLQYFLKFLVSRNFLQFPRFFYVIIKIIVR